MRPYYFDFDSPHTRRAAGIVAFEKVAPRGWLPPRHRGLTGLLHATAKLVRLWRRRFREREQLARLDHRLLRDVGITSIEAEREINKPFWRG
jgi:uncharacterized protein YjiS (DUF1127 family)